MLIEAMHISSKPISKSEKNLFLPMFSSKMLSSIPPFPPLYFKRAEINIFVYTQVYTTRVNSPMGNKMVHFVVKRNTDIDKNCTHTLPSLFSTVRSLYKIAGILPTCKISKSLQTEMPSCGPQTKKQPRTQNQYKSSLPKLVRTN